MKFHLKELFTVPNILSYIRLLLIPFFVNFYLSADGNMDYAYAAAIVAFSGLTDLLDGMIARKFNQVTELGKLLDPVADKLTQAAIVICLMLRFEYMWMIVLLFVLKELNMAIHDIVLMRKGKKLDGAKWYGKVSTAVFYMCMTSLVAFPGMSETTAMFLMVITGLFLLLSAVMYTRVFSFMHQGSINSEEDS